MTRSRIAMVFIVALGCLALPATARAQSAFTGVVKDTSGAVLPGVTVEAASPALIEKTRSVVDRRKRRLPPGRSAARRLHADVLARGFSTVKREASNCSRTSR